MHRTVYDIQLSSLNNLITLYFNDDLVMPNVYS